MNEVFEIIKTFLESDSDDATEFSVKLEDLICEKYDEIAAENEDVANILNEQLPDICADYEVGVDMEVFKQKIKSEYEKAIKVV